MIATFVILFGPIRRRRSRSQTWDEGENTMTQDKARASAVSGDEQTLPARHSASRRRRLWWGVVSIVTLGLLASAATLILLTEAHDEIIEPQTQGIDLALLNRTHTFASPAATTLM